MYERAHITTFGGDYYIEGNDSKDRTWLKAKMLGAHVLFGGGTIDPNVGVVGEEEGNLFSYRCFLIKYVNVCLLLTQTFNE